MVWNQGPGITLGLGFLKNVCKTLQEGGVVLVVSEKFPSFNSPGHYMLQEAGSI